MTGQLKKIIFASRDVGATQSIVPIFCHVKKETTFRCFLAVEGIGTSTLSKFSISDDNLLKSKNLSTFNHKKAQYLLDRIKPDLIVAGISGDGYGYTEFLSDFSKCPTFQIQDYWGDVNSNLLKTPDFVSVLDKHAYQLTKKMGKFNRSVFVNGSPKHLFFRFNQEKLNKKKEQFYTRFGIPKEKLLAFFFGQPLWQHSGYSETVNSIKLLFSKNLQWQLVYRPHPNEIISHQNEVAFLDYDLILDNTLSVTEAQLINDLNMSIFSTSGWDQACLRHAYNIEQSQILYLLFDARMVDTLKRYTNLDYVPTHYSHFCHVVNEIKQIKTFMQDKPQNDIFCDSNINNNIALSKPLDSANKILRCIKNVLKSC